MGSLLEKRFSSSVSLDGFRLSSPSFALLVMPLWILPLDFGE